MAGEQRDFFISFNSVDEAYAKAISDALRAEGFTTFFHPDDLEYGGHIPKWMNDALKNSRQMLALCSPAYMDSGAVYSEAERYARFWQDTRGEEFKLIPVVLKEVEFPPLLAVYKRLIATNMTPADVAAAVVAALKKSDETKERELLRGTQPVGPIRESAYVHISRLPETGYQRLVGRETELRRLDEALVDAKINIVSLIAEGGAGKSALANEWLNRLQAIDYPGAEFVLGWSFYSQGTERATSAEEFLNWALDKLGITLPTTSASAKADAIAEATMKRRVLLVLDGVEPLQHGPGPQVGQLKDIGLRALLRRFAATPPGAAHGLIVLTSRLAIKDIARWQNGPAPVVDVEHLSDEAGAALLRDNGVQGSDSDLKAAARDFGGHPLALGLLASFLNETQGGDVRRRDHIRNLLADAENPGHDHAARVMESYETGWFASQPLLLAIMHIVGLFDRPASGDCLRALRSKPVIDSLTDEVVRLSDGDWFRAITRLRDVRLLAPIDPNDKEAIDTHPLVREWFGELLRSRAETVWRQAHGRLYDYLRRTTREGDAPTLEKLAPLYQAIVHGCRAGRYNDALDQVYAKRICRMSEDGLDQNYASTQLGASGTNLAVISSFFEVPYEKPVDSIISKRRSWLLDQAAYCLYAQGRVSEAIATIQASLAIVEDAKAWDSAVAAAANLGTAQLTLGDIEAARASLEKANIHARHVSTTLGRNSRNPLRTHNERGLILINAEIFLALGNRTKARPLFTEVRRLFVREEEPLSTAGFLYYEFLFYESDWDLIRQSAPKARFYDAKKYTLLSVALDKLIVGRTHLGLVLVEQQKSSFCDQLDFWEACTRIEQGIEALRTSGEIAYLVSGLLARAASRRSIGDWAGVRRDLDEVEEIAELGPMRLHLCDLALERARLAFARIEAFAPLNGMLEQDSPPKPEVPGAEEIVELKLEAEQQLKIAADYIQTCGYHRRDEELAELQAVLRGEKKFAELPPRV
jgi:tetratricopeptide (TPR) repeat protein